MLVPVQAPHARDGSAQSEQALRTWERLARRVGTALGALPGRSAAASLRALARTWQIELEGRERLDQLRAVRQPVICVIWHGHFLPLLWLHRGDGTVILVSRHRDAEPLSAAASRWGYRVLRGSSTRGAVGGLLGMIRALRRGAQVAIAADGPRGPCGVARSGALKAALHTQAALVPVSAGASAAWRLPSWDRFLIPRPFSCVRVVYGRPFLVPASPGAIEAGTALLQERLEAAARSAAG